MGRPKKARTEMFDVPPEFTALIDRRTLPFLDALALGDYDLRMLLRSAYSQGLIDAMQLAGNRPNTFDAIVMGRPADAATA